MLCAFSASRISVSSSTSFDGFGGAASSFFCSRVIARMTRNSTQAMIRKLMTMVRKLPYASTAPCFFASTSESAVTFDDSFTK